MHTDRSRRRAPIALLVLLAISLVAAACGGDDPAAAGSAGTREATDEQAEDLATAPEVRLGFFPNVTHAPALVGVAQGTFAAALGDTRLETSAFNAGPEATEALFADALDITYIGPNPAVNAYAQSGGEAVRLVAGSTSGGAFLVVRPGITSAADLKGQKVASPQLGNTQDVALRVWLKDEGLETNTSGGGDVSITPMANADILNAFRDDDVAGAWVPEPWATRLIQEGGGEVLVDEADLWPEGRYVTTHLLVRTAFLEEYPGTVKAILEGHLAALDLIAEDPEQAQADTNDQIEALTQKRLPDQVITSAWENLTFTADPVASSLQQSARDAESVGLLEPVELTDIYALDLLNDLLAGRGEDPVGGL